MACGSPNWNHANEDVCCYYPYYIILTFTFTCFMIFLSLCMFTSMHNISTSTQVYYLYLHEQLSHLILNELKNITFRIALKRSLSIGILFSFSSYYYLGT